MAVNPFFHLNDHLLIRRDYKVEICPATNQRFVQYQTFRPVDDNFIVTKIFIEQTQQIIFGYTLVIHQIIQSCQILDQCLSHGLCQG